MSETHHNPYQTDPPRVSPGDDPGNRIASAIHHIRTILEQGGASFGTSSITRMEESLRQWARDLDALLNPDDFLPHLRRGGQEHDIFEREGRVIKVTRGGYFGLSPGVDFSFEIKGREHKKFKLWEATPLQYLERLRLQNRFTPGLVRLEGVLDTGSELVLVTSQPRFDLLFANTKEIQRWFKSQDFLAITHHAFYRHDDNFAVFDAHDKNVIRYQDTLIPFDVIPCHPDREMMDLIRAALAEGAEVEARRTTHTTSRTL
jgi:hypothetical protein